MGAPAGQRSEVGHAPQGPLQGGQAIEVRCVCDTQALEQLQSQLRLESVKKFQALPVYAKKGKINHEASAMAWRVVILLMAGGS